LINILRESIILYVEDDKDCRESVAAVFNNIFKKVYIASDGEEALKYYNANKNTIDIIVSDINMPNIDGIELLEIIRKDNETLPFIITSAYTESEYLLKSIELNITGYITKPLDMKILIKKIAYICKEKDNTKKLITKEQEVLLYLDAINKVAIVSKTDLQGIITYVNDIFCEVAQYTKEELIGQNHNIVRHPDIPKQAFRDLWKEIQNGNKWQGSLKNRAKDGSDYYVNAHIFPLHDNTSKQITGYIGIRFLTTQEENMKRAFKKKVIVNITESRQKEYKLVTNKNALEEEINTLHNLNIEGDNRIIELNNYVSHIQELLEDLEKKNSSKERQLTHYERQMENIDKRTLDGSKNKSLELEKFIQLNQELKNDKEVLIDKTKVLERNINLINKKNGILKDDNIRKLRRIEELEDVVSYLENLDKKEE
jgi:PAS domain S-box-containing protein